MLYLEEEEAHAVGKMKLALEIHPNALAYSMTTLGAGMMNSVFNFYYVKLFLNRYRISEVAFHQAQVSYHGVFWFSWGVCIRATVTEVKFFGLFCGGIFLINNSF